MGLFFGKDSAERKSAVKNAIAVMVSDGDIDPKEMEMLAAICVRVGVTEKELDGLLKNPKSIKFTVPRDPEERIRQLIDITFMMLADGKIDKRELALCIQLAELLQFDPMILADLVKAIIESAKRGRSPQDIRVDVSSLLS